MTEKGSCSGLVTGANADDLTQNASQMRENERLPFRIRLAGPINAPGQGLLHQTLKLLTAMLDQRDGQSLNCFWIFTFQQEINR